MVRRFSLNKDVTQQYLCLARRVRYDINRSDKGSAGIRLDACSLHFHFIVKYYSNFRYITYVFTSLLV